jgi:hypothetical protein
MKSEIEINNFLLIETMDKSEKSTHRLRKAILNPMICSISATLGIFGGISSLFAGLVCVVIHSVVPGDVTFDRVGMVLLIIAIPMLLIGAVFLDEIELKK